ncbi:hypothetical protein Xcaj_16310 [Xanthomonas axonopodis pv. cajani]|uniref:Uncharacterized protein n=1 Tax=Xanthomonas axonopodis pv. cajani TaxID=487827 RepID=A0ABX3M7X0_9XANT|nr:hypothetical protein Xcaj_16310 [Xanthomonas axonopodis pv. cajani]
MIAHQGPLFQYEVVFISGELWTRLIARLTVIATVANIELAVTHIPFQLSATSTEVGAFAPLARNMIFLLMDVETEKVARIALGGIGPPLCEFCAH